MAHGDPHGLVGAQLAMEDANDRLPDPSSQRR
jgi:hypothetical protein